MLKRLSAAIRTITPHKASKPFAGKAVIAELSRMRKLLNAIICIGTALCLAGAVFGQNAAVLKPLHSTRADVEKIAKLIGEDGDEVEYVTNTELLSVRFSSGSCDQSGWKVSEGTVLSYRSILKKEILFSKPVDTKGIVVQGTDTGRRIVSDISSGQHFFSDQSGEYVESIVYGPRPSDSSLRCAGFPEYSPLNIVSSPVQSMTVKSVQDWDPGVLFTPVFWIRERKIKLQIFAYCERTKPENCEKLRERALLLKRHLSANGQKRFSAEIGGFRDKPEIEVFALPADAPNLTPQPYYPSPWFAQEAKPRLITAVGLVVDRARQPIVNALICFRGGRIGDVFPCSRTGVEGVFELRDSVIGQYAWLVIEVRVAGIPRGVVDSYDLTQFPEFRGLRLKVPKDPAYIYELEYIRPHIVYKKVEIDLAKLFAGGFVKGDYDLRYDLFYKGKLVRRGGYVDRRDFDSETKKLTWAIPVGKWTVTFKLNNGKNIRRQKIVLTVK